MITVTIVSAILLRLPMQSGQRFWDHFDAVSHSQGERLLLILLDVNGDGRREVFMAPAESCGNGGCAWQVYSPLSATGQVRYLGEAGFSPGGYRFSPERHTITDCWHMSAANCALGEYRFTRDQMSQRNLGPCQSGRQKCEAELARIGQWQKDNAPPMLFADLQAGGDASTVVWRSRAGSTSGDVPDFDGLFVLPQRK